MKHMMIFLILFLGTGTVKSQLPSHESFKHDFKLFMIEMIKRDITQTQIALLQGSGLTEPDIRDVILNPSFTAFVDEITSSDRIQRALDQRIEQLLTPGFIEMKIKKRLLELDAEKRENMILAMRELKRFHSRPSKLLDERPTSFFAKLWEKFKKDIFG